MTSQTTGHGQANDRTWVAVLIAIVGVIPGFVVAGVIVAIYKFFLGDMVRDHWIPYLEELSLAWFPELFRGMIAGTVAISLARWRIRTADFRVARYTTIAFWGAIVVLTVTYGVFVIGPDPRYFSAVPLLIGLGVGLWYDELT